MFVVPGKMNTVASIQHFASVQFQGVQISCTTFELFLACNDLVNMPKYFVKKSVVRAGG